MSFDARLDRIPNFVTALTPEGLRRAMFRNNAKHSIQFVYHNIQFVNGKWFAWFYEIATAEKVLNDNGTR